MQGDFNNTVILTIHRHLDTGVIYCTHGIFWISITAFFYNDHYQYYRYTNKV